jgi:hypothetical protein
MAGQGTGKGEVNDKHLEILHRIERAQSAEVRIAARREKNDLIWRNAVDNRTAALEEAVFGSKREKGLKREVSTLSRRQYLAMGGLVVVSACLAWVGNIVKDALAYIGKAR